MRLVHALYVYGVEQKSPKFKKKLGKYQTYQRTDDGGHVTLQTTVKHMHRNKDKSYSCQNHYFPAQHCLKKVELQFVNACYPS